MKKFIYFDNSATTKVFDSVVDVMSDSLKAGFFNPSSGYKQGVEILKFVDGARKTIADSIAAKSEEVIFTSGGTESINTAIYSAIQTSKSKHIITSKIEHDATLKCLMALEEKGFEITYLKPSSKGIIHPDEVKEALRQDTFFVSLMHVNNEIGSVTNIQEIGKLIKAYNEKIIYHVDAVQSYMKEKIDTKKMKIDMLSLSAHKVNGPKGVGALYIRDSLLYTPFILGGGQERNRRSGTENVPGILGFEEAVKINSANFEQNKKLYELLSEKLIRGILDFEGVYINSDKERLNNIVNISIMGVKSEVLLNSLSMLDIMISSGSACSAKKKTSHVLNGIGLSKERIDGAVRISFSSYNTLEEVELFLETLKSEVEDIRRFTKYKKGR